MADTMEIDSLTFDRSMNLNNQEEDKENQRRYGGDSSDQEMSSDDSMGEDDMSHGGRQRGGRSTAPSPTNELPQPSFNNSQFTYTQGPSVTLLFSSNETGCTSRHDEQVIQSLTLFQSTPSEPAEEEETSVMDRYYSFNDYDVGHTISVHDAIGSQLEPATEKKASDLAKMVESALISLGGQSLVDDVTLDMRSGYGQ
ncbi:hypothetical protein L198_07896 [Cryptococcus wingfieldii CBS 7118]|uniref:Uncharacterized protein n=1 Tax=Cryptococcus wingfieldii CBS 7118 TaxID=1295528 RepID=A0A1E3HTX2_9TREE|nr:hypothetical protein L198_07896 [Cryptococcus wingfieldii CBS 7118]ODN79146.1 hypothetical protein L198_07896 [Cryptococcus wingfieldii CBS 7118]